MDPVDPPDHAGRGGPPIPPDDRLWRHPSEMGWAAGMGEPPSAATPAHPGRRPPPPSRGRTTVLVFGSALVGGGLALLGVWSTGMLDNEPATQVVERVEAPQRGSVLDDDTLEATLDAQVLPAMARVDVRREGERSSGSAIVFRSDGHLLTSSDAVAGASRITVSFPDGRSLDATLVGTDPVTDIAVLHVDATDLPTVLLGSGRNLQLGEPTFAVDASGGAGGTPVITAGVISGLAERLESEGEPLYDMIATNTGSSGATAGAALVDSSGAVIGIATTRQPPGPTPVGSRGAIIRYATPISYARSVANQLADEGVAHHTWLGVDGVDQDPVAGQGSVSTGGAEVTTVRSDSPAASIGLQPGDVITAIDDVRIGDMSSLVVALRDRRPDEQVRLTVERNGERVTFDVTLGDRPAFP